MSPLLGYIRLDRFWIMWKYLAIQKYLAEEHVWCVCEVMLQQVSNVSEIVRWEQHFKGYIFAFHYISLEPRVTIQIHLSNEEIRMSI